MHADGGGEQREVFSEPKGPEHDNEETDGWTDSTYAEGTSEAKHGPGANGTHTEKNQYN